MRLRDLLARPELRLRLLHGDDDALDRPLRGVCTTDLLDPGRYLSPGDLVVSGLVWRTGPADSEVFVAALARAGAAALAAGEAVFHDVPDDVVDACRRHGVPLLAVPEEVAFGAVTGLVVGRVSAARGDRLATSLGRQRRLLAAVAGGLGLDELVARVSAEAGSTGRVLTASGRVVAGPPLPPDELDAVVAAFLGGGRTGAGRLLAPVGRPAEPRLTSWCVAVDTAAAGAPGGEDPADAAADLCAFAALDRTRRAEGRRAVLGIADDAVALLASGGPRSETAALLRSAGLDTAAPLVVVVARAAPPHGSGTARAVLADALGGPGAVAVHEDAAVALLPDGPGVADLLAALRRLAPGLPPDRDRPGPGLAVGVGPPAGLDALAGALQEARNACGLAADRAERVAVVTATEVTSHVGLLAAVPEHVRRAFADRALAPVLAHDARAGTGLLATLEAFLDCDGSWSRTAARLHLHVNSVRYRIARVEELTGRDLGTLRDRVDLLLALAVRGR